MLKKTITAYMAALTIALSAAAPAAAAPADVIRSTFGPFHDDTALCIARAESRLRPWAISPTGDHGLFQVNAVTWFGETIRYRDRALWIAGTRVLRKGQALRVDAGRIYGGWYNSKVAWVISKGGSRWSPWTGTYGRGLCRGMS